MTTENRPAPKVCRDCYPTPEDRQAARIMGGAEVDGRMVRRRPANEPGPRCATHWRAEQKRRKAAAHDKRVQDVYGLEPGEYDRLYAFQGGKCALCRRATGRTKKLAVDHDHASGAPRGLLCSTCNRHILGHARDQIGFFRRCIVYLQTTPYERMRDGGTFYEGL